MCDQSKSRFIHDYQKRMNKAAQELCVVNPGYIRTKQELMNAARAKIIDEGFEFVKGKSRSKTAKDANVVDSTPKQSKCSQNVRDQRLKYIE